MPKTIFDPSKGEDTSLNIFHNMFGGMHWYRKLVGGLWRHGYYDWRHGYYGWWKIINTGPSEVETEEDYRQRTK